MAGSPLLGYNTNVRHLGKLYHIQTEDSGSSHGHIFTHLFADGGRIIASKKTTYAQYVGTTQYPDVVKKLMRESHKAMFIALRDGLFDEDEAAGARAMAQMHISVDEGEEAATPTPASSPEVDVEALERAAAARLAEAEATQAPSGPPEPSRTPTPGRYRSTRPATTASSKPADRPDPQSESIFGGDLLSEKSLDEVILSYLAEDVEEEG
ncbi:MAG TPA: hypothetical protein RMH99_11750 [Sandaracinaceae bacterium LLY-WYZ-13_1]|nr:hypothetical protein [Sandaracinaceae bacterium LLY-WYZ-13_1]